MPIFDTHAHYDSNGFNADRDEVLSALPAAGVGLVVDPGCDAESSRKAVALAEQYPHVYAAVGIHPEDCAGCTDADFDAIRALCGHEKVVAIGEIGLDYYYDLSPRDVQAQVCEAQMELAWELDVPVAYHIRDAHQDMLDIMKRHRSHLTGGIIHCFSGSWEIAKEYLKLGYYISFAGPVTFRKAPKLQECAVNVPRDRLLIETDSPYLAPEPVRGRRNEPTNVRYVCEKLAALRGESVEELAACTTRNALAAYRIQVS